MSVSIFIADAENFYTNYAEREVRRETCDDRYLSWDCCLIHQELKLQHLRLSTDGRDLLMPLTEMILSPAWWSRFIDLYQNKMTLAEYAICKKIASRYDS